MTPFTLRGDQFAFLLKTFPCVIVNAAEKQGADPIRHETTSHVELIAGVAKERDIALLFSSRRAAHGQNL